MSNINIPFKQEWWDTRNFERVVRDQAFGFELDERFCSIPDSQPPRYSNEKSGEHDSILATLDTGFSEVVHTTDEFEIHLKVKPFKMENIEVKSTDDVVKVVCQHPDVIEGKGEVRRKFKRVYALPKSCDPHTLKACVRTDGVLVINCKKGERSRERTIPLGFEIS